MSDDIRSDREYAGTSDDVNLSSEAKLRLQSYVMTNGTRFLFISGIVLVVLSFIIGASSGDVFAFMAVGGCGISMLLITAITRPLDRILAQLIDLNDKLDDEFASRRE